jgi:CRISPR-associated Csx2 family protein
MSKILIASVGTGTCNPDTQEKKYAAAKYYLKDRADFIESAYIYDALKHFCSIDKLILVGTCGSAWHLLYAHLFETDSAVSPAQPYSDEYFHDLFETNERKDKPDIVEMRAALAPLKAAMGDFCAEIVVLEYGMDQDEILKNFELLSAVSALIDDGDDIYFDITHSFRSLAFYELLAVSYIKDALKKDVKIKFVSYGMFEFSRENDGFTPIADLSQLVNIMDWIKAAEEYKRYGTAYLLAELLEKKKEETPGFRIAKEERKALRKLGDTITGNDLLEFKGLIKICVRLAEASRNGKSSGISLEIRHIFDDLAARFGDKLNDDTLLYTELSKWHFEHKRYLVSAITLTECVLDYCAGLLGIDRNSEGWSWETDERSFRTKMHNTSADSIVGNFLKQYETVNRIRNELAHGKPLTENMKSDLEKCAKGFFTIIKNHFREKPENEAALIKTLRGTETSDVKA